MPLQLRFWKTQDQSVILNWRNHQETRKNSLNRKKIQKAKHATWFHSVLTNPKRHLGFLAYNCKKQKIGVVRFSRRKKGQTWEIHFIVAPKNRGHGLAQGMIQKAIKKIKKRLPNTYLTAKVKLTNPKSLHILESLGFKKTKTKNGIRHLRLCDRSKTESKIEKVAKKK